ncbi:Gfo/Idh/MocA family protein [Gillisia limnaea]|uniref:Oxidoreductase domain protein n=1 Tax=Gillisia limnaea (strain DSM 15749 / LMG 21470 / R-8282) TaxID=865937 RepID=H2BR04_GILLR|nr:Gfo/Idh/MocA family oxidoreductase [Gillisia limnaea]EHQ04323.1 oxidoreductase domain protein [Gillisia limnaea DSM 15749]
MTTTKTFKWGIVGPGKIAGKFATDLAMVPGAELYAVASRDIRKARAFSAQYNFKKSYGTYEELALDKEVDIVYIATPHVFHNEHTLLCLKNKKAVLCEKPLAMNSLQVEEMIRSAKENKVFLMEAMWTYFLPHYQYVLDLIKTEKFGTVKSLEADFGFAAPYLPEKRLYNKALGGGSLLDIGIYPLFAALSLMGVPNTIKALAKMADTGVDESCDINLEYNNGAVASLSSSINMKTPTTATITFERAIITLKSRFHEPTSILINSDGKQEEINFDITSIGYNFEAIHVQQMLAAGRLESTIMTFQKSRELVELLDKVREKIGLVY